MTWIEEAWIGERILGALALVAFLVGLAVVRVRLDLRHRRAFRARLARLDQLVADNRERFAAMGFDVKRQGTKLVLERKERP